MSISKTASIYKLTCTETGCVMYVGRTCNLKHRKRCHFFGQERTTHWIHEMIVKGFTPKLEVIETPHKNVADITENYWIEYYHNKGMCVFNTKKKYITALDINNIYMHDIKHIQPCILKYYCNKLGLSIREINQMKKGNWYNYNTERRRKNRNDAVDLLIKQTGLTKRQLFVSYN